MAKLFEGIYPPLVRIWKATPPSMITLFTKIFADLRRER